MVQNIKLYYNFGVRTILRHINRCPKVKTNFATYMYPKLGHGREYDLGLRFVLRWSCLNPKTLSRTRPKDIMSTYFNIKLYENKSGHYKHTYFNTKLRVNKSGHYCNLGHE